ncbi:hypothetical protein [Sinorhizobium meliloti]|uniref:hypothetical protein n=1 Tax=Rhizobium meliloti TaxID=382 RepID=UPI001911F906|nr:hypothetical protein [Sinorhizobium meliloti]
MAKNSIRDWDVVAVNNTDIAGIGITGANLPSNFDNAMRTIMGQVADVNTGVQPVSDTWTYCDPADTTKRFRFDAGSISTATTRVVTMPNADFTIGATSGANVPLMNGANTWSAIQTISNASGGAGDTWGGRLLSLENFAPGIFFKDNSGSVNNGLISVDSNLLRVWGTPNTDGTSLTERFRLDISSGRLVFGERVVSTGTDAIIGTTTAGQVILRPNGGDGAFVTGQLVVTPSTFTWNTETVYHSGNVVPVADGGTGSTTAAGARTNIGLGGLAVLDVTDLFYTGSSSSTTSFPIGAIVSMVSDTDINRNGTVGVCLRTSNTFDYVNSGAGSAGAALAGTWRSRGRVISDAYIMQRVA